MKRKCVRATRSHLLWLMIASLLVGFNPHRANGQVPQGARTREATVTRVVDGDTLKLSTGETVRLIGVDTPETVDPRKPVERFGKEASAFTKRAAEGKKVRLELEGASNKDKYGRTLAYVWLPDGKLLNAEIIRQGYGHAYVQYPFARMEAFRALEKEAREKRRGLWGDPGPARPAKARSSTAPTASGNTRPAHAATGWSAERDQSIVYVTNTGSKFHRDGCRYLKSRIPMRRAEAIRAGYEPCKVCRPR